MIDSIVNALILLSLFLEIGLLQYFEYKAWHTLYTPLSMLMLPYLVILIITLCVAGGSLGFVEFYYPSILIWNIGLIIFAIPSFVFAFILQKKNINPNTTVDKPTITPYLTVVSYIFSLLFLWHLKSILGTSAEALGSDEFGEDFSGYGLWGHLRMFTIPLLMICIYYADKRHWWVWIPIIVFIAVSMLNQVKGWTIIPCVGALALRLYTKRTRLTTKFILWVVGGVFGAFFSSYALSILVVQDRGVSDDFMEFIFGHFFHYLTSGTLGWSMDVERGIPDDGGSFEMIIAQFINLSKTLIGDKELVSPINPLFFNTGRTLTNVRTIFGTLYINTNCISFTVYIIVLSTLMYSIKLATIKYNNIYIYCIYFLYCTLLIMGWFDLYFANLTILEVPIITIILMIGERLLRTKSFDKKTNQK